MPNEMTATHAYLGFFRCGHMNYMAVDMNDEVDSEDRASLANDLSEIIKAGGHVTRATIEEARKTEMGCPDDCPLSWKNNIEAAKAAQEKEAKREVKPTRTRRSTKK